jgi:hypothetical protein
MSKHFLFLFAILASALAISCERFCMDYVEIINNSEHNITCVMIINSETGYVTFSERDDELIAKNGGSKTFEPNSDKNIVCVQAEDTSGFMCALTPITLKSYVSYNCSASKTRTLVWNGSDDPAWQPQH